VAQEVTRRRVLAAAAAALPLLAAGCKGIGALGTPPSTPADVIVVADAIAVETGLIARYTKVLAAQPALAARLHPILAQHQEHLTRLRGRLIVPKGRPAPTPAPSARTSPAAVPGTAAGALAYLRDAENTAAAAQLNHLGTVPPVLAELLASISTSEATHALLLAGHGRHL
jgi:hypothetical protein